MQMGCSISGFVGREYPKQGICDIAKAGFENIFVDLNLFCTEQELEELGKVVPKVDAWSGVVAKDTARLGDAMASLFNLAQANQLKILLARAPYLLRNTKRLDLSEKLRELAKESISLCAKAGCRYVIVRPLFAGVEREKEWEINREFYMSLADLAKEQGVQILLENQCRSINGHPVRGICSDAVMAAEWVDRLNEEAGEEVFGFCMDAGAYNLCGQDMNEVVRSLGKRIKAVLLRDCDGHTESSMLPFSCAQCGSSQTDWLGLIRSLRDIGYDGLLMMDMKDTAMAFSPLLRPPLLGLAKAVIEYFMWQISLESMLCKYSSIVLFGAGNMCKNFMAAYGDKYPPLFTCDNNEKLWGASVCGLEIRPPEALKNLPAGCGVFICNIYYREIEMQLRELGIENIEFFNDEYMPSFYLEGWERGKE